MQTFANDVVMRDITNSNHTRITVMTFLTKAQRKAVKRIYDRGQSGDLTYRQFRNTVVSGYDCAMVKWSGMWLGIELDGYTHS